MIDMRFEMIDMRLKGKPVCLPNDTGRHIGRSLRQIFLIFSFAFLIFGSCQKIEYRNMDDPAYIRVFNSISYYQGWANKNDTATYLCMLINPEFDASGLPVSAETVGDFLAERATYSPPYPSSVGTGATKANTEYPGKKNVLVGPILNGFNLSSWAQTPSGTQRIMFYYRPKSEVDFFDLSDRDRKNILVDTIVTLQAGEVYTLQVLLKDFATKKKGFVMRQENFHKQALSDSLVYVNFYNYSAEGYWQAPIDDKVPVGTVRTSMVNLTQGIRDEMNVYLTLMKNQEIVPPTQANLQSSQRVLTENATPISADYTNRFLTSISRTKDLNSAVANTYYSFPLWAAGSGDGVTTSMWQSFTLLAPGLSLTYYPVTSYYNNAPIDVYLNEAVMATLNCLQDFDEKINVLEPPTLFGSYRHTGFSTPNLIVNAHSGYDNPRSFATVNTIEIINGKAYLTTIQRRFDPPLYQ